jgi:hypothetical protein
LSDVYTNVPGDICLAGLDHGPGHGWLVAPEPLGFFDVRLLELVMVSYGCIAVLGFLSDGDAWLPFDNFVRAKAHGGLGWFVRGIGCQEVGGDEVHEEGGVGKYGTGLFTDYIHIVIIHRPGRVVASIGVAVVPLPGSP